jgi:hypothetical protein
LHSRTSENVKIISGFSLVFTVSNFPFPETESYIEA